MFINLIILILALCAQSTMRIESIDLLGHEDRIQCLSLSPNGELLASGSRDGTVKLWKVSDAKLLSTLDERMSWPMAIRFSPDGRILAAAYEDGAIHLWDSVTHKLTRRIYGHMDPKTGLAFLARDLSFSPDSNTLASASDDETVRVWDIASGHMRHVAKHMDEVWRVVFSHDGTMLASNGRESVVRIWDVASGEKRFEFDNGENGGACRLVVFSPDDRLLACAGDDPEIRLWDLKSGRKHAVLGGGTRLIHGLRFFPSQRLLLSAGKDRLIRLWDIDSLKVTSSIPMGDTCQPQCIDIAENDRIIAALDNGDVAIWRVTPPQLQSRRPHQLRSWGD